MNTVRPVNLLRLLLCCLALPPIYLTQLHSPALGQTASPENLNGEWRLLETFTKLHRHTGIYDPIRHRIILFAGINDGGHNNSTWELSLSDPERWTKMRPAGSAPPARYDHCSAYDSHRDRMLVFGGGINSNFNDTWSLDLDGDGTWTSILASGTLPATRRGASAIYDSAGDRLIIFGGATTVNNVLLNDVWSLSLGVQPTWTRLIPSGTLPSARMEHTAAYDPIGHRMIVYGGGPTEVWALSLVSTPAWSLVPVSAGPSPDPRSGHAASYDPVRHAMVIVGGFKTSPVVYMNDVWVLTLDGPSTWTSVVPAGSPPDGRQQHTMVHDPQNDRFIVCSGAASTRRSDTWALTFGNAPSWSLLLNVESPVGAEYCSMIYDSRRDRIITFGGYTGAHTNALWTYSVGGEGPWIRINTTGPGPSPRYGHSAIYDPQGDRMIVYGGDTSTTELWQLSMTDPPTWSPITAGGILPPGGRALHTAVYDSQRHRMIIYGGIVNSITLSDAAALDLTTMTWERLEPKPGRPSERFMHAAVYDPVGDRMIIVGGHVFGHPEYDVNDMYELRFADLVWNRLSPTGAPYYGHSMGAVYDPVRHRLVIAGPGQNYNDWALPLAGPLAWNDLPSVGVPRPQRAAVYDPLHDQAIFFRGGNEIAALTWGEPVAVSIVVSSLHASWEDNLAVVSWNVPESAEHSTFEVYRSDISGEKVKLTGYVLIGSGANRFVDPEAPEFGASYWLLEIDRTAKIHWYGPVLLAVRGVAPAASVALKAFPNPAHAVSHFTFAANNDSHATVRIRDVQGRLIKTLLDGNVQKGTHELLWDRLDSQGALAPRGVYFVTLQMGIQQITRKLTLF